MAFHYTPIESPYLILCRCQAMFLKDANAVHPTYDTDSMMKSLQAPSDASTSNVWMSTTFVILNPCRSTSASWQ